MYGKPEEYYRAIHTRLHKSTGRLLFHDRKHPLADKRGRVLYHRHIASVKIGRWLTKEEHVHHIDDNPLNNSPSNLEILSHSEHASKHHPLTWDDTGLALLVWQIPMRRLDKLFGVSYGSVWKRCKKLGISRPPRGHWQKQ